MSRLIAAAGSRGRDDLDRLGGGAQFHARGDLEQDLKRGVLAGADPAHGRVEAAARQHLIAHCELAEVAAAAALLVEDGAQQDQIEGHDDEDQRPEQLHVAS